MKRMYLFSIAIIVLMVFTVSTCQPVSAAVPVYPSGLVAVHRFYNVKTLTHFYTPDENEVIRIQQTLPDFHYEGIKFNGYSNPGPGRVPVYRFYNTKTLTHFYTSDQNEVNTIRATLADYSYEGISYYADSDTSSATGKSTIYRFYNTKTLTHLYTADQNEANVLRATNKDYRYEGSKFGALSARYYANCTDARNAGVTPLYRGEVGYGSHLDRDNDGIACEDSASTPAAVAASVSISADGCDVTATGTSGLTFEYGAHDGTFTRGYSDEETLTNSATATESSGGDQGMTSYGIVYDRAGTAIATNSAIIQATTCP